jgi:trimeric autotransporter adhesin
MSTKTLRKRIALVAVSALGFGLVSVVPASAGDTIASSLTLSKGSVVAGAESVSVTAAGVVATPDLGVSIRVITPTGARLYGFGGAAGTDSAGITNTTLAAASSTFTIASSALLEPGSYTITAATGSLAADVDTAAKIDTNINTVANVARSVTLTVASPATSTAMAASMDASTYAAASTPIIRAWGPTNGFTGSIKFRADVSPDLDVAAGAVFAATVTGGAHATYTVPTTATNVAGSYSYTAFVDTNGDNLVSTGEVTAAVSFTIGGAFSAAVSTLSVSRATVLRSHAATAGSVLTATKDLVHVLPLNSFTVTLTARDADGNAATPTAPAVFEDVNVSNMNDVAGTGTALVQVGTSNVWTATFTVNDAVTGLATSATGFTLATFSLVINGATVSPAKTATTRVAYLQSETTVATLSLTDTVGIGSIAATGLKNPISVDTTVAAATALAVTVDRAVGASLVFNYAGPAAAANQYILVGRTATAGTSTINVPSTAQLIRLGSDAKASWTETVTAVDKEGYTLNVYGGNATVGRVNAAITVTFATATPAITVTPTSTVLAKDGATTSFAGVLADQFGRPIAAGNVFWSVAGRNPATGSVVTGTNGAIPAVTVVDASKIVTTAAVGTTAATVNTDTITFTYNYSAPVTAAAASVTGSRGVTYSLTGPSVASVAVASATTTQAIDQAKVDGTPAAFVRYTATVRKADNTSSGTGILCTWAGGAGDQFRLNNPTSVTDADGLCFIDAFRDVVGSSAITATAVGVTSPVSTPVRWVNRPGNSAAGSVDNGWNDARNIAVTAGTAVAGTPVTVLAKVTDRFGNPVAGVLVTFGLSGVGRLVAGDSLLKSTNSNGEAQIQVVASDNETGTNTVSATKSTAQSLDRAGFVSVITGNTAGTTGTAASSTATAGVTAAVATASAAVTFTKNTSTSTADALLALATALGTRDQASAAVDAAAEATDAANAATDAANAAAEAADAATAAAQDAADAVAALSTQVSEMVAALKKQITSLTNLVIKIQKKVRA